MKTTTLAALLVTLLAASVAAQEASSYRVDTELILTSDYVWRGISRSNQGIALQGEFGFLHRSGLGFQLFGSSIDFADDTNLEIDARAGYTGQLYGGFELEAGARLYTFPGSEVDSWFEYFVELRQTNFRLDVAFSSDVFSTAYSGMHYGLEYEPEVDLCWDCPGSAQIIIGGGYTSLDREAVRLIAPVGTINRSYWHWKAGIGYVSPRVFRFNITYQDTDGGEVIYGSMGDRRYVATVSKEF